MAVLVTKYSLQNLKNKKKSNGNEVLKAINSLYDTSIAKFKLINIKDYLNQNGYYAAILDSINVNK